MVRNGANLGGVIQYEMSIILLHMYMTAIENLKTAKVLEYV